MFGENEPAAWQIRSDVDGELHPNDIIGELCDSWRGAGYTFVRHADGEYEKVAPEPETLLSLPEHNPKFVKQLSDEQGRMVPCVTVDSARKGRRPLYRLPRLMAELPLDYLVYRDPRSEYANYHPSGVEPLGIKLSAILAVKTIVEAAHANLPKGASQYPAGEMVLSSSDKYSMLDFLKDVLTPPSDTDNHTAELEPHAPVQQAVAPAPRPAPAVEIQSAPHKKDPWFGPVGRMILRATSFTFGAGAVGLAGAAIAESTYDYPNMPPSRLVIGSAALAVDAVLTYIFSRE